MVVEPSVNDDQEFDVLYIGSLSMIHRRAVSSAVVPSILRVLPLKVMLFIKVVITSIFDAAKERRADGNTDGEVEGVAIGELDGISNGTIIGLPVAGEIEIIVLEGAFGMEEHFPEPQYPAATEMPLTTTMNEIANIHIRLVGSVRRCCGSSRRNNESTTSASTTKATE